MILYHGSKNIIETPKYGLGRLANDYGQGFYCTEDMELASEWAVDKDRDGYVNNYEISLDGLALINLNSPEYNLLNWISILLKNRNIDIQYPIQQAALEFLIDNYYIDVDNYDIVCGYRADDSFFTFARDFISNQISVQQLRNAMRLGNLGEQIVIKSLRAFGELKFLGYNKVLGEEWYPKKSQRDINAREKYLHSERMHYEAGGIYIRDIIERKVDANELFI